MVAIGCLRLVRRQAWEICRCRCICLRDWRGLELRDARCTDISVLCMRGASVYVEHNCCSCIYGKASSWSIRTLDIQVGLSATPRLKSHLLSITQAQYVKVPARLIYVFILGGPRELC